MTFEKNTISKTHVEKGKQFFAGYVSCHILQGV